MKHHVDEHGAIVPAQSKVAKGKQGKGGTTGTDGFDTSTVWYHGSGSTFGEFNPGDTWLTSSPEEASRYAEIASRYQEGGAQVYPVHIRGNMASQEHWASAEKVGKSAKGTLSELKNRGFDGFRHGSTAVVFHPKNIRSVYAFRTKP